VRSLLLLFSVLIFASAAQAQEQEGKLVDRLLRPNMELSNPAQNKSFSAVEGTSINKKFNAKEFYSGPERPLKSFWGAKSFLSKTFGTGKYARAEAQANFKHNADVAYASTEFTTKQSSLIRESSFARKKVKVHDYADNRPFLAKGTRQKQLSQQDKPMSIDEVRELLNKSR
jgi:hypothetical protein